MKYNRNYPVKWYILGVLKFCDYNYLNRPDILGFSTLGYKYECNVGFSWNWYGDGPIFHPRKHTKQSYRSQQRLKKK
jgi:hypothetical protein